MTDADHHDKATFAGGCFWCLEPPYERLDGVITVTVGYTGGHVENPTYHQVTGGDTGHVEAVQIVYDPARITFERLLDVFWRSIDPLDGGGQLHDRGPQYRTVIFYHDDSQREAAEKSKRALDDSGRFDRPVATEIRPAATFYPAEDYHQKFHRNNPMRYQQYHHASGRDRLLKRIWGDDSEVRPDE